MLQEFMILVTNKFSTTLRPETLAKKEKAQAKILEERAAAKVIRQKVCTFLLNQ